jgi:hypothetical protein
MKEAVNGGLFGEEVRSVQASGPSAHPNSTPALYGL